MSDAAPSADRLRIDLVASGRLPSLATAYLEGRDRDLLAPLRFLAPGTLPEGAPPEVDRSRLAAALGTANAAYGHPAAAALAAKLAAPATRVVVTGQQPGLFGGPLLSLSKMAAAVRWAEALEAAGMPAVAVFWVATEDHDWAEVAQATVLGRDGAERLDLGEDPSPLTPVGMRTFGPALGDVLARAAACYPGDLAAEAWARIGRWYRPDARFGEAFCRYLIDLLGARAPLMLDSMNADVKRLERPHLRRLVEQRAALADADAAAAAAIEARGHTLQVRPQPGVSPLFLLHGQARRRIAWAGDDAYSLRGVEDSETPIARLLEALDDNPAAISPGVLARPAIQDALLGTTLQVMGPAETAYLAQVAPAYRALGIAAPWTTLRPQAFLLEHKQAAQLEELDVDLATVLATPSERLVAERLGENLVGPAQADVAARLAALETSIRTLDQTLLKPLAKTADQIERALDQLRAKVDAAVARRHQVWLKRLQRIHQTSLPGGAFAERTLAVVHLVARYGPAGVEALVDGLDLDPRIMRAIRL